MSRDGGGSLPRSGAGRAGSGPRAANVFPEPPESSFWLERTPLPTARRPGVAPAPPAAGARARGRSLTRSPQAPPGTVCPKCDSPLSPSEPACPSCGLRRAMFGRFRTGASDRVPASLEQLWRQVEARWSEPELHERFLAQVSLCGSYAYAASRYRRAARLRQSDAIAKLQLERLSRMVHAVMAVSAVRTGAGARSARPYRGAIVLLILLLALGGVGTLYMLRRRSSQAAEHGDRVAPSITVRRGRSLGADGKPAVPFGGMRPAGARSGAQPSRRHKPQPAEPDDAQPDEAEPDEAQADDDGEPVAGEE